MPRWCARSGVHRGARALERAQGLAEPRVQTPTDDSQRGARLHRAGGSSSAEEGARPAARAPPPRRARRRGVRLEFLDGRAGGGHQRLDGARHRGDRAFSSPGVRFNKRKSASRADIFSRTMAAASGSSTFLAPGAAPCGARPRAPRALACARPPRRRARRACGAWSAVQAKSSSPRLDAGQDDGSAVEHDQLARPERRRGQARGRARFAAHLGFSQGGDALRGVDALEKEGRGYREYILLRSLGLKVWFTTPPAAGASRTRGRGAPWARRSRPPTASSTFTAGS